MRAFRCSILALLAASWLAFAEDAPAPKLEDIRWLSSEEAFAKARDEKTARWVLVYKEWPK